MNLIKLQTALALSFLCFARLVGAFHTTARLEENPFSEEFREAYRLAAKPAGLVQMLDQFQDTREQVELHFSLGLIYNQRTGKINYPSSIVHFKTVLSHKISTKLRVRTLTLLGGSYSLTSKPKLAIAQYLNAASLCAKYDLPRRLPKLPAVHSYKVNGPQEYVKQLAAQRERQLQARRIAKFRHEMRIYEVTVLERIRALTKEMSLSNREFNSLVSSNVESKWMPKFREKLAEGTDLGTLVN